VGHRTFTTPKQVETVRRQFVKPWSTARTHEVLDKAMEARLNEAYEESKSILLRNKYLVLQSKEHTV